MVGLNITWPSGGLIKHTCAYFKYCPWFVEEPVVLAETVCNPAGVFLHAHDT